MRIVDTFLFHNELDILEIRLRETYDKVDRFVIAECDHTFTGNYKGFILEQNIDRFKPWMDKITYLKLTDPPIGGDDPWVVERWQRDQFNRGWADLGEDDVIVVSDVDELVRPEAFDYIRNTNYGFYGLAMPMFYFKFNYMDITDHYPWRAKAYRGFQTNGQAMRIMDWIPGRNKIELHHCGWHFSWLGDNANVVNKIRSFSHKELNKPEIIDNVDIEKYMSQGRDHFTVRPAGSWGAVKLDGYFPKTILENLDKYKDYIIPDGPKSVQEIWKYGILDVRT